MDTVNRSVRVAVDGAPLAGELSVPPRANALVVFVTGDWTGGHTARESNIADLLFTRGIGTLLVDLVADDATPTRATRSEVDLFAQRLEGVLAWLRSREATRTLDLALYGADTGAAAVLQVLSTADVDPATAALLDGRVDLADGDLGEVRPPLLFVVDADNDHLGRLNRRAYEQVGTDSEDKNLFWADADADDVFATAGWFESHLPAPGSDAGGVGAEPTAQVEDSGLR